MRVGTKSLLIGAHQFIMHPALVALAWRRIYGEWPDMATSVAIAVHDWSLPEKSGAFMPSASSVIMIFL